jgi:hypothetical protein
MTHPTIHIRTKRLITASLTAMLVLGGTASALDNSSARAVAMGGAYTALASGPAAPRFNPANLGLANYHNTGIEFVGVGASITNNSFSLADYNKYTGAFLTDADKIDILGKVPGEGLKISADVDASTAAIGLGHIALSFSGVAAADINLNKDIVDLILNGNTFADTISVTGSYASGLSYASAGLSYGMSVFQQGSRQIAVGVTGRYLRGVAIQEVTDLQGGIATYASGFDGAGHVIARTAQGGAGYAVDLGAALKLSNNYTVGVKLESFLSRIKWDRETEERGYVFSFDSMNVDNADADYVTSDNYTKDIPAFTTTLPARLTLGFGKTTGRLIWAVDWEQGFRTSPGASTKPRLSTGAELSIIPFLPLRGGYAVGGSGNTALSFGSGLRFFGYYLDVAVVSGSTFSGYSAKGLNLAFSTGILF